MRVSYEKLWEVLSERNMKRTEFAKEAHISSATLAKMGKGENLTTDILLKVCDCLNCDVSDIMEVIREEDAPEP